MNVTVLDNLSAVSPNPCYVSTRAPMPGSPLAKLPLGSVKLRGRRPGPSGTGRAIPKFGINAKV